MEGERVGYQPHSTDDWIPRIEHVWVTHIRDERRPALLIWWRRVQDQRGRYRWEGWVIYAIPTLAGISVSQDWVYSQYIERRE